MNWPVLAYCGRQSLERPSQRPGQDASCSRLSGRLSWTPAWTQPASWQLSKTPSPCPLCANNGHSARADIALLYLAPLIQRTTSSISGRHHSLATPRLDSEPFHPPLAG